MFNTTYKPTVNEHHAHSLRNLRTRLNAKILGKSAVIDFALTTLIAGGHLLLEDVPGVGKTTLARELAGAFEGDFKRIQFTSDLLPMDVIGVHVYRRSTEAFEFNKGPVFANFVLADERRGISLVETPYDVHPYLSRKGRGETLSRATQR